MKNKKFTGLQHGEVSACEPKARESKKAEAAFAERTTRNYRFAARRSVGLRAGGV